MVKIYLSKCIFLSETGDCLDGAIVTDGGNIAFVGDRQEALQEFPEGKVIDLGNRTVTAGLIETHSHIYAGGRFEQLVSLCVDPAEAEDVIMQKMKDFVETTPIEKDRIYLIYNYDFASAKKITRYGLDEMFGKETPVILADISLHGGAFSSKALELLGYKDGDFIPQETDVQYEEDGKIGYFVEGLFWPLFTDFVLTDDRMGNRQIIDKTIDTMQDFFAGNGYTTLVDMIPTGSGNEEQWNQERYLQRQAEGTLKLRTGVCLSLTADKEEWIERKKILSGEYVFFCGLKGFVDGGFINSTAWTTHPYETGLNKGRCGAPTCDLELYQRKIIEANELGIPVRVHAEGDKAISEALRMYEVSDSQVINQVEHCTSMPDYIMDQIREYTKKHPLIFNMQPVFLYMEAPTEEHPVDVGNEFYNKTAVRVRSAMNAGAMVSLGSADFPATFPSISDHIRVCVNRLVDEESSFYYKTGYTPQEAVTIREFLTSATYIAAKAIGRDDCMGVLKKGYKADLTVFDCNLIEMDRSEYKDITIYKTIVNGEPVYEKEV